MKKNSNYFIFLFLFCLVYFCAIYFSRVVYRLFSSFLYYDLKIDRHLFYYLIYFVFIFSLFFIFKKNIIRVKLLIQMMLIILFMFSFNSYIDFLKQRRGDLHFYKLYATFKDYVTNHFGYYNFFKPLIINLLLMVSLFLIFYILNKRKMKVK